MFRRISFKAFMVLVLVLGVSCSFTSVVSAQSFDVDKAIAAGDHKGLAAYYKSQAEAQRKIVEMHKKMKASYREGHVHYKGSENVMTGHCSNLQLQAEKMAEQYEDLAKQEENLAVKNK